MRNLIQFIITFALFGVVVIYLVDHTTVLCNYETEC